MEQREAIEMLFWEVIDGHAGEAEQARAKALMDASAANRALYRELQALHKAAGNAEQEQPSLRFSRNVMEAIARTEPARPVKKYYNPWILGALGLVFALLIGVQAVPLLKEIGKSRSTSSMLPSPDWSRFSDWLGAYSGYAIFLVVPVVLLLLDALIKKRRLHEKTGV